MSAKEEALKKEFHFASSSIVAHIVRGVLVGIVVGCIVSSFRFLIEHIFHFIDEGISDNGDGSRTLHLTLYHNQNGDYEAFTRKSYLSIPLWAYEGQLTQGDKVVLRINTYEKGFVSYEFTY